MKKPRGRKAVGDSCMTWNKLKWIAFGSMLLDHFTKIVPVQGILLRNFGVDYSTSFFILQIVVVLGRIAFPIFAFGIAQGCAYTHDPGRYLFRLFLFALVSEVPFNLTLNRDWLSLNLKTSVFGFHNVFFTLFLGAVCCFIYQSLRDRSKAWVAFFPIGILVFTAEILGTDYGGFGVLFILAPFILFQDKQMRVLSLGILSVIFYVFVTQFTGFNHYVFQWLNPENTSYVFLLQCLGALMGVALLAFYNGQRGKQYQKWIFYFLYPGHLLLFYLIAGKEL